LNNPSFNPKELTQEMWYDLLHPSENKQLQNLVR